MRGARTRRRGVSGCRTSSGCESSVHGRALSAATKAIAPESGQIMDSEVCATAPSVVAGGGDTTSTSRSQHAGGSASTAASNDCDDAASSPSHEEESDDKLVSPFETGAGSASAVVLDDAGGGSAGSNASLSWGGVTVHADPSKEHGRLLLPPSLMAAVIPPSPPPVASRHSGSLTARARRVFGAAARHALSLMMKVMMK